MVFVVGFRGFVWSGYENALWEASGPVLSWRHSFSVVEKVFRAQGFRRNSLRFLSLIVWVVALAVWFSCSPSRCSVSW